jgi:GT2 family glycosyltransferase
MNSRTNLPLISVVIPNYNGARYLGKCLQSLQAQSCKSMEIVVVDNASQDGSVEIVRAMASSAILLNESENLGFAGGVNAGIGASHGDWIAVLNNDTELAEDWLGECLAGIQKYPDAAFFACRILDFSSRTRLYSAGDCFLRCGVGYRRGQEQEDREDFHQECEIFSASGCAALYRRKVLEEMGRFDESFFAYFEDVDLGFRLQAAGYRGYYLPRSVVYHHGAATSGGEFSPLAVRLRTRNSLLLLLKNMPALFFLQWLPMIVLAQLWWLARVAAHGRPASYIRGLSGAFLAAPAIIRNRIGHRVAAPKSIRYVRQKILGSESLARRDFQPAPAQPVSFFLKWYFRLF